MTVTFDDDREPCDVCGHDEVMHGVNAFGGYCRACDSCDGYLYVDEYQ